MKVVARYEGTNDWVPYKDYEVDISLDIGRGRDEEPVPIITLHESYWVKCYHSLEEFFKDWRIVDAFNDKNVSTVDTRTIFQKGEEEGMEILLNDLEEWIKYQRAYDGYNERRN